MISKRIKGKKKKNRSILVKRIISIPPILLLTLMLATQALGYTTLNVKPTVVGYHSVPESSGTVASRAYSGIYWMISDYLGRPEQTTIYAVNSDGDTVSRFPLQGATNWNWEDIAIDGSNNLWVCDIGDNEEVRNTYKIYKVPEPSPYKGSRSISPSSSYTFKLPGGSADMDSCFVWQGIPYFITNSPYPKVYKLPYLDSSKTVTAQQIASFSKDKYIGGADISVDGRRLALSAIYSDNQWVIERSSSSGSVADFFNSPSHEWKIHFNNGQGEGITFVNGKYDFIAVSESGTMRMVKQSQYDKSGSTPQTTFTTTSTTTTTTSTSKTTTTTTATSTTTTTTTNNTTAISTIKSAPQPPTISNYSLTFQGYDYDNQGEVSVLVNNQTVATLPQVESRQNSRVFTNYTLDISGYTLAGNNTVTFKQNQYSSGVRNVMVTGFNRTLLNNSSYHNLWLGGTSSVSYNFSTVISNATTATTNTTSPSTVSKAYNLSFAGYDYNNASEVTITLNGKLIASLPSTDMPANNNAWFNYSLDITGSVISGNNTLIFTQNINSSSVANITVVETSSGQIIYSNSTQRSLTAGSNQSATTYVFKVP